eukprot:SAG22_NODE_315_length_12535_cov_3.240351_2_plen_78_part_00
MHVQQHRGAAATPKHCSIMALRLEATGLDFAAQGRLGRSFSARRWKGNASPKEPTIFKFPCIFPSEQWTLLRSRMSL